MTALIPAEPGWRYSEAWIAENPEDEHAPDDVDWVDHGDVDDFRVVAWLDDDGDLQPIYWSPEEGASFNACRRFNTAWRYSWHVWHIEDEDPDDVHRKLKGRAGELYKYNRSRCRRRRRRSRVGLCRRRRSPGRGSRRSRGQAGMAGCRRLDTTDGSFPLAVRVPPRQARAPALVAVPGRSSECGRVSCCRR